MATCNLELDNAYGSGQDYTSGVLGIRRHTPGVGTNGYNDGKAQWIPLSNPHVILGTNGFTAPDQGVDFDVLPPGATTWITITIPNTASAKLSDLLPVVIPLPTPSQILDAAIADRITNGPLSSGVIAALIAAGVLPKVDKPTLAGRALTVYGDSFVDDALVPTVVPTTAGMYFRQFAALFGGGAVTTYGVSGTRINHTVGSLLSAGTWPGLSAPKAGAVWPGTSSRPGDVVIDTGTNDWGHYPGTSTPAPITGAGGDRYINGMAAMYEAACALASTETRREVHSGASGVTVSGTWAGVQSTAYLSAGNFDYTVTPGSYVEMSVTPPQSGPLAGKVFLGEATFDPGSLPNAAVSVSVDGGTPWTWAAPQWETWGTGTAGWAVIPVDVPVDGAAHTVRWTHAGANGDFFSPDVLLIPSTTPADIYVMQAPDPVPSASGWTAAQIAVWKANRDLAEPKARAKVALFPNAVWVPTTMTPGGYAADGTHPKLIGQTQRANDLAAAFRSRFLKLVPTKQAPDLVNGTVPVSQLPSLGSTIVLSTAQTATAIPIPATATTARVKGKGAAGGGGSGRRAATSTYRGGGGSGGTGGEFEFTLDLVSLRASGVTTLYAWIGAKGTGGAAKTTDTTDGSAGTDGGETFISTSSSVTAATAKAASLGWGGGGSGGFGGNTSSNGNGGAAGYGSTRLGGAGASGSGSTGAAGAGGAGGGITASNSVSAGGASDTATDTNSAYVTTGNYLAGGAIGTAGLNASTAASQKAIGASPLGGSGGGGSNTAAGGNGGNGYNGGSGGGGGASINGFASGKGGDGSDGVLFITFT